MEKPEKKKKRKSKIGTIVKELRKTEQGKTLLFFGFYAIFFVLVIVLVRTSHNALPKEKQEIKKEINYTYNLDLLEKKNYHYKYLATIGENAFLYEGDSFLSKERFTAITTGILDSYYRDGSLFIRKENEAWKISENPYLLGEFYEVENIKKILKEAKFISKTEYKNGEYELKFVISTPVLVEILTNEKIELEESNNEITVKLDKEKNITDIEYDITNYNTWNKKQEIKTILELSYTNFGKIKEIEKP